MESSGVMIYNHIWKMGTFNWIPNPFLREGHWVKLCTIIDDFQIACVCGRKNDHTDQRLYPNYGKQQRLDLYLLRLNL